MMFHHSYSDGIANKKIAIMGVYPPPFGGVSVHIQRVMDKLLDQKNNVFIFNTEQSLRYKFFLFYLIKLKMWLLIKRPTILYFHSTYLKSSIGDLCIIILLKPIVGYKLIIVEHDCRHLYKRKWLYKKIYRWILKYVTQLICIGPLSYKSYEDNQMDFCTKSIEGAFLAPVTSNREQILQTYPSSLFIFFEEFTPLILINGAYQMIIDGRDVYGFYQSISMLAAIKKKDPNVCLLMGILLVNNDDNFLQLQKKMKDFNVSEHVYILQGQKELWPLFDHVDLFIRPTLSDGASISLQEALYFNVPCIASDCCKRPTAVVTYKTNDNDALVNAVNTVLEKEVYGQSQHKCDTMHP